MRETKTTCDICGNKNVESVYIYELMEYKKRNLQLA